MYKYMVIGPIAKTNDNNKSTDNDNGMYKDMVIGPITITKVRSRIWSLA